MRFLLVTSCMATLLLLQGRSAFADGKAIPSDAAVVGSVWVGGVLGVVKRPGEKPEIRSADTRLVIVERDGEAFAGIMAMKNGEHRGEVRGTIKPNGAMQFIVTKDLSGGSKDVVGLVKVKGALKEGRMTLSFTGTVGTKRLGSIGLELQKPDGE